MNTDDQTLAENKVLILYILSKVGKPIPHNELLDLVMSISDVNYFYFEQYLLDLLEDKYIEKSLSNDEGCYNLTQSGSQALAFTIDMVPGISKLKIDSKFKENLDNIKDKNSAFAEYSIIDSNNYEVVCKIVEHGRSEFELKLLVGSVEQAKKIVSNWNNSAEEIYPNILNMLS